MKGISVRHAIIRNIFIALLAMLALLPARVAAVEGQSEAIDERTAALHQIEVGKRAMIDSNALPARAVDAALAFTRALRYFGKGTDTELICDLEANIFWCKKRMNEDELKAFLAARGSDAESSALIAEAAAVVAKKVTAAEAQGYFDRAAAFAHAHPDDIQGIITRYFEVAERFPNTDLSAKAQTLSLEAQKRLQASLDAEKAARSETIFMHAAPPPPANRLPLPDADALRAAVAEVRKQYKADYALRGAGHRRHFAEQLAGEAATAGAPAAQRWAMFEEAAGLALEAKAYDEVLRIADAAAASFASEAKELKQRWLGRDHGNPTASAILKLLDTPLDKAANLEVGRFLCFDRYQWDVGIPVLAHGGDADLKTVAEMEQLKPEGAQQQIELADRWYELASKSFGPPKENMMARSYSWYRLALPNLTGITKERIAKRKEEVGDLLPAARFEYFNCLTERQWNRVPGRMITLPAASQRQDLGLVMTKGMRVRIVPHPTDTWNFNYSAYTWKNIPNVFDTDCWGFDQSLKITAKGRTITGDADYLIGATVVCIEKGPTALAGLLIGDEHPAVKRYTDSSEGALSGLGHVYIGPRLSGRGGVGKGQIRIKIMPVDDE